MSDVLDPTGEQFHIERAVILKGKLGSDPSALLDLPFTYGCTVALANNDATISDPTGVQLGHGRRKKASAATIQVEYAGKKSEIMEAFCDSLTRTDAGSLLINDRTVRVTDEDFESLVVVPVGVVEGAIDSFEPWWFPDVRVNGDVTFPHNEQDGQDAQGTYTVNFQSVKRYRDQAGNLLPEGTRLGFRGSPNDPDIDLPWALPSPRFDAPPTS